MKLKYNYLFITFLLFVMIVSIPLKSYALPAWGSVYPIVQDTCQWKSVLLAPGIIWKHRCYTGGLYGNQSVNIIDVDLSWKYIFLFPVQCSTVNGQYSYELTSSIGERTYAVAGINGGFFCYYTNDICTTDVACPSQSIPLAFLKINGMTISYNCKMPRTTFGITLAQEFLIRQVAPDSSWDQVYYAIGAGPNLVSLNNGKPVVNVTDEGFPWDTVHTSRTAVGLTGDNHLLLVTVDSKQHSQPEGMDLYTLAGFLINELNVSTAMNFDGGGSTTMYVRGYGVNGVVNKPRDGSERRVYDGLFVYIR